MKNRIYKYFFHEFIRYFTVVLFALTAIIWTIQAVNFLDLVTDDGHAFKIYFLYSLLTLPKILTKLISSNKFTIKPRQKKVKLIFITTLQNSLARYLFIIKDLIIFINLSFHI